MIAPILFFSISWLFQLAAGHVAFFHPSMWGFNVTTQDYPYDNRAVSPLTNYTFDQWWFHGHLDHPPNDGDVFELPVGETVTGELACNKGATSFFASSDGGNIINPNNIHDVCPGSPMSEYHTTGLDDLTGCALAIAYKSNVSDVTPDDFAIFSVNQTCVIDRLTGFQVPERMPPCPPGGCICAWFWIHSPDSGGEQNYMNGFKCDVTGSTSTVAVAKPQVPRRCGADPKFDKPEAVPGNCTYGAKSPFYWFQAERNNMFEGAFAPPFYTDLYNFVDGAQSDIFLDSYVSIPVPGPNQTALPVPADLSGSASATITTPTATSVGLPPVGTASPSSSVNSPPIGTSAPNASTRSCKRVPHNIKARSSNPKSPRNRRRHFEFLKRSRKLEPGKKQSLWHMF